ncbi:MAG: [Fe-Fe] hydrogenase large subunit C-terminal domain-containing protein [Gemmatimonadaceae bacterium]
MSPRSSPVDTSQRPYEVAIVGNDMLLAARPARAMQLAHALLACGFDLVVPVSWGDEAIAEHVLRTVVARGTSPAIFCACPSVRARLLATGSELAPHLISLVAPCVATARYLRALQPDATLRVTYIGRCEGGRDGEIERWVAPTELLAMLVGRGISLARQPAVFDSVVPPDRRRFFSQPGGCPTSSALADRAPERRLVTITDEEFSTELAQYLVSGENVLVDLAPLLACACCGGVGALLAGSPVGRDEIARLEPPPALSPILDLDLDLDISLEATIEPSPMAGEREVERRQAASDLATESEPLFPARLPGAQPIEPARLRAEQRRIAVTPAGVVSVPAHASPARESGASRASQASSVSSPLSPSSATAAEHLPHVRDAGSGELHASEQDRTPTTSPIQQVSYPSIGSGSSEPPVAEHHRPAETVSVRHRTPVHQVFHVGRLGPHPRAHASDGVVLPRAYVGRRPSASGLEESDPDGLSALPEVERPLRIDVEPLSATSGERRLPDEPIEASGGHQTAGAGPESRQEQPVSPPVAAPFDIHEPTATAGDASRAAAPAAGGTGVRPERLAVEAEARTRPAGVAVPPEASLAEATRGVRERSSSRSRIPAARAPLSSRERKLRSVFVFVASVVAVAALIVALAVILRRTPALH